MGLGAGRRPLEALGHTVETLDLPGSGADQTRVGEVTLERYAERVGEVLAAAEPAVLVGLSMGGVVITQAAADAPELVRSLIFVCAFMPGDGQSLLDLTRYPEGATDMIQANMVVEGDPPVSWLADEVAREAVYGSCTDEQADWAIARRRPQAVAPFGEPVRIGGTRSTRYPARTCLSRDDRSCRSTAAPHDPRAPVRAGDRDRCRPRSVPLCHGQLVAALDALAR